MASSRSQYTDTLQKVSNVLTEKNVKDLGFLCDDPSLVKGVTNANELFEVLQDQELLSERNVNVLIDWLDELEISNASKFLKDYNKLHVTEYRASCHIHEDQSMTHFCVSCNTKVCPECYAIEHSKHDKLIAGNPTEIESIKENPKSVENLVNKRKNITEEYGEDVPSLIRKDCLDLMENISKCKRDLIAEVDRKELADKKRMMETKRDIQVLEEELDHLGKLNNLPTNSSLQELETVNAAMKRIIDFKKQLDHHIVSLDVISDNLLYRNIPNDGTFGTIPESTLIGSTTLPSTLLVHMHDERHLNGNVLLVFVDLNDTSKQRFKHSVKIDNRYDPVVMSNICIYDEGLSYLLFAVGSTVFIIYPHWTGSLCDSVGSVSPLLLRDVPEGSWITSLTAHDPGTGSHKEFLISINSDCILREYDVTGSRVKTIDATNFLPGNKISKIAYFTTILAIIVQGVNDVIMLYTENAVKALGSLKPKKTDLQMVPINLVWTGLEFLVLYISEGVEKKWKVISYSNNIGIVVDKLCDEGTSSNENDIAVNVTRCDAFGYISFANCTTRKFQYPPSLGGEGLDYLSGLTSLLGLS